MNTSTEKIALDQIRERLVEEIRRSGKNQSQIARELGVHHSAVGYYLSGRAMPALDTFANLCKILDVDPAYILCIQEH